MDQIVEYSLSLENDGADGKASMLSILHEHAVSKPDSKFLIETSNDALTYGQTWPLVSTLIPNRLRYLLAPALTPKHNGSQPRFIILSHNSVFFPLVLWSLWSVSAVAVLISTNADLDIWTASVNLISPDAIFVTRNLKARLLDCLGQEREIKVVEIESIIPNDLTVDSYDAARSSSHIPSLLRWLNVVPPTDITDIPLNVNSIVPETMAVTLFTSSAIDASTLKSVTYTHGMLVRCGTRSIAMLGGSWYSEHPKRHLGWLPLNHAFELCFNLCGTVLGTAGAYIFFEKAVSSKGLPDFAPLASHILAAIAYHQPVDAFCTVPAIFSSMADICTPADINRLRSMKCLGVGGAPIPENLFEWAASQGIALADCMGATDVCGPIAIRRALVPSMMKTGLQIAPGLMGVLEKVKPHDNFGELVIRATFLPHKYDNIRSDAYFYDANTGVTTYHTGDLYSHSEAFEAQSYLKGAMLPKYDPTKVLRGLKYLGRIDDLVVFSSGTKIDALALERILDASPDVSLSAIVGDEGGTSLLAYIQPKPGTASHRLNEIVNFALGLNRSLPFEQRLRKDNIHIVENLPVTTKLTLNRKKLKRLVEDKRAPKCILRTGDSPANRASGVQQGFTTDIDIPSQMKQLVLSLVADIFSISVDSLCDGSLGDCPMTSLSTVQLARSLSRQFNVDISSVQVYKCVSVDDLCHMILSLFEKHESPVFKTPSTVFSANNIAGNLEDLIISGVACRLPGGVDSLSSLWSSLILPDSLSKISLKTPPSFRWDASEVPEEKLPSVRWLEDDALDNLVSLREFFGLKPSDAADMSPNARLVLQLAYAAIEDAGIAPKSLSGRPWGIFSSVNASGWRENRAQAMKLDEYAKGLYGSAEDAVGARVSYFLNLTGPAIEIKCACSSSAVAVHQACAAIRNGDCEAAVVVSAVTHFHPCGPMFRLKAGIASPSGRCNTFGSDADGFLPSEGAAAIIIQKANDARADAYALIRATAITQDGRSRGFFSPNPAAQRSLLEKALRAARCGPNDISYLEAHGTGTRLGDAIEISTVNDVFGHDRVKPLFVGSSKSALGHLEEAAGLIGIMKAILCFRRNAIPPQPGLVELNDEIDLEASKIVIPKEIMSFVEDKEPRLISVSSFGLSGTLAHTILQEPQRQPRPSSNTAHALYLISGRSEDDFDAILRKHYNYSFSLDAATSDLDVVCRTTQLGRDHHQYRRAWTVSNWKSLRVELKAAICSAILPTRVNIRHPKIGLWFALPFLKQSFAASRDPLMSRFFGEIQEYGWDSGYEYFKQQLAIALMLRSLGYKISAVGGEGISEYIAAVFAGVFPGHSLFQSSVDTTPNKAVYSVVCSKDHLTENLLDWTKEELSIYGQHSVALHSLIGSVRAIEELKKQTGLQIRSHPGLRSCSVLSASADPRKSNISFVSGHLGAVVDELNSRNIEYWRRVPEREVDSPSALSALANECDIILSIGGSEELPDLDKQISCLSMGDLLPLELIRRMYELGCDNIDWMQINTKSNTTHIPTYKWALDS